MDKTEIINLLSAPLASESDANAVKLHISGIVLKAYKLTGQSNNTRLDIIREQQAEISEELYKCLKSDEQLKGMRFPEIDYAVISGIKGLLDDKPYGMVTFQSMYKWLNAYMSSSTRKNAMLTYAASFNHKQIEQKVELSQFEKDKIIEKNINLSYQNFLESAEKTFPKYSIGQIYTEKGKFAGGIMDPGNAMASYLIRKEMMSKTTRLIDFFTEQKQQKKTKIF